MLKLPEASSSHVLSRTTQIPTLDMDRRFELFSRIPVKDYVTARNSMDGYRPALAAQTTDSPLGKHFFTKANANKIQKGIGLGVKQRSNMQYDISPPRVEDMRERMETVFLRYARNRGHEIEDQVRFLNQKVVDQYVDELYHAVQGQMLYRDAADKPRNPIPRPIAQSRLRGNLYIPSFL